MTLHMDIIRWSIETRLIIFFAAKHEESLHSQQKQDLELTVAQIISSILQNSVRIEESNLSGKPLGHSGMTLNHIPYNYTVEVTNRFKGLNLVHRVPEEQWMEVPNTI